MAFRRLLCVVLVCALAVALPGCVERRLTVRSNPPGAQLFIDDYEIGTTPVSVNYTYYARARKIRLVKDGYETAVFLQPIPAPWYQYFPFDFVTENLVPGQIRDERVVTYQMQPAIQVTNDQLLARAESLRQNGQAGAQNRIPAGLGPPAVQPGTAVPPNALPPNTLPAPTETLPAPSPTPIVPPGQSIPPGQYPQPGAYPPPGGYSAAPGYTPALAPMPAQPMR
jgi:PEGA domain-containing protein